VSAFGHKVIQKEMDKTGNKMDLKYKMKVKVHLKCVLPNGL